jgi:hypothetical protein
MLTNQLLLLQRAAAADPTLIMFSWHKVGLQYDTRHQEDNVFIWNSKAAHVYDRMTRRFILVSPEKAGYYPVSLYKLEPVSICLMDPSFEVVEILHDSMGDNNFITFLGLVGKITA